MMKPYASFEIDVRWDGETMIVKCRTCNAHIGYDSTITRANLIMVLEGHQCASS